MQNKGTVLLFAITLAAVCIYQLSFTGATYKVRSDAKVYAEGNLEKETKYLDSISGLSKDEWSFLGNTFKECQEKELNLGLDLRGGMNVILEISVKDIVLALSNYNTDEAFNQAIAQAERMRSSSQEDFLDLFLQAYEEIAPGASLSAIFATMELRDQINFNTSNAEVIHVLKQESQGAIDNSFNILRSRIDRFGVTQPNISQMESRGRILVELPGVKDPQRVRKLLQGSAQLEFWETYDNTELFTYLQEANQLLKEMNITAAPVESEVPEQPGETAESVISQDTTGEQETEEMAAEADTTEESLLDLIESDTTAAEASPETIEEFRLENPLFAVLYPNTTRDGQVMQGSAVGYAHYNDTATVNRYLKMNQIRSLFPRDVHFSWDAKPVKGDESESLYYLHALKITTRDGRAPLEGDVVTSARVAFGQFQNEPKVTMSMNGEGAKTWARLTRENTGKFLAVVLDDYVRSSARVSGEIKGGSTEISGGFTYEEAEDLANILKSGKLPAPATIIQDTVVGPSLGKAAIRDGFRSFLIAFIVVLLYMIFYYSHRAGLVADLALVVNMFFIMGVLASLNAVLTLPGIAGIVLTIGISVDANVLIYERIREELRAGKGIKLAIADGYRNAYSAIIDANITTLLTGIILYVFGTGPIKGFATTLVIGVLTSLFCAIFITRLVFERFLKRNNAITFASKATEHAFANTNINFIGKRKIMYVISGIAIAISVFSLFTRGLNQGVDFTGGRTYVVQFNEPITTEEVAQDLALVFGESPMVVIFGNDQQVKITTQYKVGEPEAGDEVENLLYQGLKPMLGDDVSEEEFLADYRQSSSTVGPTIADDIKIQAVWAILFSLFFIFIYILIRFSNWRFGLGALVALIHDSIIVMGLFSLFWGILPFSLEIDQAFIAAILTVVGYSINDTVVVFDRIREFLGIYKKRERTEIMNRALNSTISRTFSTSLSTFVVLLAIFIFGGEVIRGFTFALLVGVVVGTYSSLFIATPLVYDTIGKGETERVLKGKKS